MVDNIKTIKFQMLMSPIEAELIDDWGFKNRIRTRAEAIRRLVQMGFAADKISDQITDNVEAALNTAIEIKEMPIVHDADNDAYNSEFNALFKSILEALIMSIELSNSVLEVKGRKFSEKNIDNISTRLLNAERLRHALSDGLSEFLQNYKRQRGYYDIEHK